VSKILIHFLVKTFDPELLTAVHTNANSTNPTFCSRKLQYGTSKWI